MSMGANQKRLPDEKQTFKWWWASRSDGWLSLSETLPFDTAAGPNERKMASRDSKTPLGLISGQRPGLGAALYWRPQAGGGWRGVRGSAAGWRASEGGRGQEEDGWQWGRRPSVTAAVLWRGTGPLPFELDQSLFCGAALREAAGREVHTDISCQ